jgi:hypothetical protein
MLFRVAPFSQRRNVFFPGVGRHRSNGIFDAGCLVRGWRRVGGRRLARIDFVLDV